MRLSVMDVRLWRLCVTMQLIQEAFCLTYKVQSDEEKLLDYLFQDYNPSARPVLNSSKTVTVNMQFSLLQIQELNVRSQVLTTTGLIIMDWVDERLSWDNEISTLDSIVIDGKKLWRPEFAIINGAESIYGEYDEFHAVIYPSGAVRWEPGGVFKTMCNIDITFYPFDEQTCDLVFGAWSYYTTKMNLTTDRTKVNMDTYEINGEWTLKSTAVLRREFNFECCPHQRFSNVKFSVELQRRHTFYIMNVILPGILTSAVLLSIFFCTPSQKVHIGVAALLSFRLFLLNVADTIPRTSDHVPLLGIYLTCTMAITTLAMVATVFVLNLYGMKEKPVPAWAKKIFVVYVARILCMCNCAAPQDHLKDDSELGRRQRGKNRRRYNYKPVRTTDPSARDSALRESDLYAGAHAHFSGDAYEPLMTRDSFSSASPSSVRASAHASPVHLLHGDAVASSSRANYGTTFQRGACAQPTASTSADYRSHGQGTSGPVGAADDRRSKDRPDYGKDWVHVAAVCDRLFFWLCFLFISVTTLLLFHPLTTSRYFKIPILEAQGSG